MHLDAEWILKHHQSRPARCRLYHSNLKNSDSRSDTTEGESGGWADGGVLGRVEMATPVRVRLCRGADMPNLMQYPLK